MNTLLYNIKHIALNGIKKLPLLGLGGLMLVSCSDMLTNDSELVEFSEDNTLNHAKDSISSVMGIINKIQVIADRNVLLGDIRSDLFTPTAKATTDIKDIANFSVSEGNKYNQISDYYAVINNCNYYLQNVDTSLTRLSKKVFEKEYAVVKTYRAWTFLQAAKVYGKVPLMLTPALTESQAQEAMKMQYSDIKTICNYFIDDIKPYVDTEQPNYGTMYNYDSRQFFIPVRVLLGEMCLWAGRYQEAAQYLYDYLTNRDKIITVGTGNAQWSVGSDYDFINGSVSTASYVANVASTSEIVSFIPMETSDFNGVRASLEDIYSSTLNNNYYCQIIPSSAYQQLSSDQHYCILRELNSKKDTIYAPTTGLRNSLYYGDLRLCANYSTSHVNRNETSLYSPEVVSCNKVCTDAVRIYRRQQIYLMFAEALNRLGMPNAALCVLKYGLRNTNIDKYVPAQEKLIGSSFLSFDDEKFPDYSTQGIHARGCGDVNYDDTYFVIPQPETELASYQDTVNYQIPKVEDLIVNEMALEEAYEGNRFYDLMRIALRRNSPAYLALPISWRSGEQNMSLYNLLLDENNWYLPIE